MSFGVCSVTAETDCSLAVPLSVTAVNGKTTFGRSLISGMEEATLFKCGRYVDYSKSHTRETIPSKRVWSGSRNHFFKF